MGINRPSLYAAFGNKEKLFRKALDRYGELVRANWQEALAQPSARAFFERLLRKSTEMFNDRRTPRGCLMVHGALACGENARAVRKELNRRRANDEKLICKRLKQAQSEGDLPKTANPSDLAAYVVTVIRGMAVQSVGGARRKDLDSVIRIALRAFPE